MKVLLIELNPDLARWFSNRLRGLGYSVIHMFSVLRLGIDSISGDGLEGNIRTVRISDVETAFFDPMPTHEHNAGALVRIFAQAGIDCIHLISVKDEENLLEAGARLAIPVFALIEWLETENNLESLFCSKEAEQSGFLKRQHD
jgi:hypothetical protein